MSAAKLADLRVIILDPDPAKYHLETLRAVLLVLDVTRVRDASDVPRLFERLKGFQADVLLASLAPAEAERLAQLVRRDPASPNPKLPIIVVSTPMTPADVTRLRDAGVTEMLVHPITVKSLGARLESAVLRPRSFVQAGEFVGPDRRRRTGDYQGEDRRRR